MIPPEVLQQLNDIRTPPAAGPWPPAPGWWVLAVIILSALAIIAWLGWRHYRRHAPRREALARLGRYPVPETAGPEWYAGLNRLLKETALSRYPGDRPDALSGDHWSDFLARTSGNPGAPWNQLVTASYRPGCGLPPAAAVRLAEQWIRRQRW